MRPSPNAEYDGILDLEYLDVEEERREKEAQVARALAPMGLLVPPHTWVPSPTRVGVRARVRLHVGHDGRFVMHAAGSHTPVSPPLGLMARPEIQRAAERFEAFLVGVEPGLRPRIVEFRSDGVRVVTVLDPDGRSTVKPGIACDWASAVGSDGGLALGGRTLAGDPTLRLDVGGVTLAFGPLTFFQVNLEVNRALVEWVTSHVDTVGPSHVLDMYGGAGNLSLPAVWGRPGRRATIWEAAGPAAADARRNARALGCPAAVIQADASRYQAGSVFFEMALLDPPRAGAGVVLERICLTRPGALVLVSCQAGSFARDLRTATLAGYRIEEVRLFDMFPLTSHVESVALLVRRGG